MARPHGREGGTSGRQPKFILGLKQIVCLPKSLRSWRRVRKEAEGKKSTLNKRGKSRMDMRPHFDIHYCLLIQRSDPELRILQYLGLIASPPVKGE